MNPLVYLLTLGCVSFLAAFIWVASWPLPEENSADGPDKIEDLLPLNTEHFPQLKQALYSTDELYIRQKLSKEKRRFWHGERLKILDGYLDGLALDFGRVVRLGRVVDSLAPDSARTDGTEREILAMRFRLHYRILSLRIFGGGAGAVWQLRHMTASVESLSALAEAGMMRLETRAAELGIRSNISV